MVAMAAPGCFHCGQAVPRDGPQWRVNIEGIEQPMCCPGCQAVAQTIVALGQAGYYRERSAFSAEAPPPLPPQLALYDNDVQRFRREGDTYEAVLSVDGIRCAACVWLIEKRLLALPGILSAQMNVATERLHLEWDGATCQLSGILAALRAIGYTAVPFDAARHGERLHENGKAMLRRLFVAGLAMMQVMMYAIPAYLADDGTLDASMASLLAWASLVLTLPAVAYSALPFLRGAWTSLRAGAPGMDVPVALGIVAAFGASSVATLRGQGEVYFDSVTMFIFLLLCSRYLELTARRKAAAALERLQGALPAAAFRLDAYPASRLATTVDAQALVPGDLVLVKLGEAVPADGVIVEGEGALDLSLLSGESAIQARAVGAFVPGGAVNAGSALVLRVAAAAGESTLAGLVKLVEQAGRGKPHLAQWADLVASRFVLALLAFAVAVFGFWCWYDVARAWPIAIAVLVVSCPCALSLATPSALAAATDNLLRRGVLVVRSHVLETLHRATHIVFDKTGTLTVGQPRIERVVLLGELDEVRCRALAATLESDSAHPLARAFAGPALPAAQLGERQGQGMEGSIDGVAYRIGSAAFAAALAGSPAPAGLGVYLARQGQWLAGFALADPLRADAQEVVRHFQQAGKTVMLLSGDQRAIAQQVGARLGITCVEGDCTPAGKLARIRALQAAGAVVAMVGDGINDAAVLSAADVSFAMGEGAALAHLHADAVLLSGRLASLGEAATRAARAMAVIRQNLAWATLYNALAIPAAALGWITPWMSGVGMAASSAFVVLNALRLRRG
ncbi:MAG: heavy metal translocating P-type ATPase [Pseudomonadota bacterium]